MNGVNIANGSKYTADSAGNYSVKGITYLGCESYTSSDVLVTVYYNPVVPVLSADNDSICTGSNTNIISSAGNSYLWYLNGNLLNTTNTKGYTVSAAGYHY